MTTFIRTQLHHAGHNVTYDVSVRIHQQDNVHYLDTIVGNTGTPYRSYVNLEEDFYSVCTQYYSRQYQAWLTDTVSRRWQRSLVREICDQYLRGELS